MNLNVLQLHSHIRKKAAFYAASFLIYLKPTKGDFYSSLII